MAPCCTFACIRSLTFRDTNYGHLRGAKVKWESPGVREEEDEEDDWRRCVRQCQVDSRPAEVSTKQGGREGGRGEGEMSDKKQETETWLTSNLVFLEMGRREGRAAVPGKWLSPSFLSRRQELLDDCRPLSIMRGFRLAHSPARSVHYWNIG